MPVGIWHLLGILPQSQGQNILMWSTTTFVHMLSTLQYQLFQLSQLISHHICRLIHSIKIHLSDIEYPSWGGIYLKKTSQAEKTIKIVAKRQLMQCIEIFIYISAQKDLLWTIPDREYYNTTEVRIPSPVIIVDSIKIIQVLTPDNIIICKWTSVAHKLRK